MREQSTKFSRFRQALPLFHQALVVKRILLDFSLAIFSKSE